MNYPNGRVLKTRAPGSYLLHNDPCQVLVCSTYKGILIPIQFKGQHSQVEEREKHKAMQLSDYN